MIRLKEIKLNQNNGMLSCLALVEDSNEPVNIVYRLSTGEIQNTSLPNGYEWCAGHIGKAKRAIKEMVSSGMIPNEKTIMWY